MATTNTEAMERNGMLSAPMTKLERDTLIEYTGAEHCDYCRLGTGPLCSSCAVKLRWEATVRALESRPVVSPEAPPPTVSELPDATAMANGIRLRVKGNGKVYEVRDGNWRASSPEARTPEPTPDVQRDTMGIPVWFMSQLRHRVACTDAGLLNIAQENAIRAVVAELLRSSGGTPGDATPRPTEHGRNCGASWESDSDCRCGLVYRQQLWDARAALGTEQTMHAAWRKRAEEAEAEIARLRAVSSEEPAR